MYIEKLLDGIKIVMISHYIYHTVWAQFSRYYHTPVHEYLVEKSGAGIINRAKPKTKSFDLSQTILFSKPFAV